MALCSAEAQYKKLLLHLFTPGINAGCGFPKKLSPRVNGTKINIIGTHVVSLLPRRPSALTYGVLCSFLTSCAPSYHLFRKRLRTITICACPFPKGVLKYFMWFSSSPLNTKSTFEIPEQVTESLYGCGLEERVYKKLLFHLFTPQLRNSLLAKLWNEKECGPSHGTKTYTRLDDVLLLSSSLKPLSSNACLHSCSSSFPTLISSQKDSVGP
jgi:hypothetical protein